MHVLIARQDYADFKWGASFREAPGLPWSPHSMGGRLEPEVDAAIKLAFSTTPPMVLTFSTRTVEDTTATFVEAPADLGMVPPNFSVEILCREGRLEELTDCWCSVTRSPGRADLWSNVAFRFRPQLLRERIKNWFQSQHWESFGPPTRNKPHSHPLPYERTLLVRHGAEWRARAICPPGTFPEFRDSPAITPEQEAKRLSKLPQNKLAAKRARHAENAVRFRREAAERAALREQQETGA
jgi:hypothetical protein